MKGSEKATGITMRLVLVKFQPHHVMDSASIKVKVIVTQAESYDELLVVIILYPMDFTINFWNETASYRP